MKRFSQISLMRRPNILLGLCFLGMGLAFPAFAATTQSLLSPAYERLAASELGPSSNRVVRAPSEAKASEIIDAFFYLEHLDLTLQIHRAKELGVALENACDHLQSQKFQSVPGGIDRARVYFVCALYGVEAIESASPWEARSRLEKVLGWYDAGLEEIKRASQPEQVDRFYAEGRLFQSLPATTGMGAGRSLVALQLLHRMEPTKTSLLYFLSRGFAKVGNTNGEKTYFAQAVSKKDPRAALISERDARIRRKMSDGLGFGFSSSLFFAPGADFGFAGGYHDDRLFDDDRAFSANGSVTTRGQWAVQGRFEDYELLSPSGVSLSASVFRGEQDRFEVGPHSRFESRFVPKVAKEEGKFALIQPFWDAFSLGIGWWWYHETVSYALNPNLIRSYPDGEASYFSAPFFEMKWDSRNSDVIPTRGILASFSGSFPTQELLSPRSFEKWEGKFEAHFANLLFRNHVLSLFAVGGVVTGNEAPWSAFPRSEGPLRGVRQYRFQDRGLIGASAEYRLPISHGFGLSFFATALSVGGDLSSAIGGVYEPGYGGGLTWSGSQKVSSSWKLLISRMGGETLFIASGGIGI